MELNEFETQFRSMVDLTLNQLQTVTLLIAQLQRQNADAGDSVQRLTQFVEDFVAEQRNNQTNHEGESTQ
jgi:ferritin